MAYNQYCIGSTLSKFLCFCDHDVGVVEELVLRELFVLEGIGSIGSEDSAESDHADTDSTGEFEQLGQLLLGQKDSVSSFGADVGS